MRSISSLPKGTKIKIIGEEHGHQFDEGAIVIVGELYDEDILSSQSLNPIKGRNCIILGGFESWYIYDGEFERVNKKIKLNKLR